GRPNAGHPAAMVTVTTGSHTYRESMDASPLVTMEVLWPDLPEQPRPYEVVVTVPRQDGGEPLVPRALPPDVLGCWTADRLVISVTVVASRPSTAVAAIEALVPKLARAAEAVVT